MSKPMPSDRSTRPAHRAPRSAGPMIRLSWEQQAVIVLAVLVVLALALLAMMVWW